MGLLFAECLPDETAIDRANAWTVDRDELAAVLGVQMEPADGNDDSLDAWDVEPWDPPTRCWLELRLGALRELFSHEAH